MRLHTLMEFIKFILQLVEEIKLTVQLLEAKQGPIVRIFQEAGRNSRKKHFLLFELVNIRCAP